MNCVIGQMERRNNVPWRTSTLLGLAKAFDARRDRECPAVDGLNTEY